jgi:hypothetical protein
MCSDVRFGLGQPRRGSADRGEGARSTVDDPRIGLQVKDFSIDLEGNGVDRRKLDATDVCLGSEPNGRARGSKTTCDPNGPGRLQPATSQATRRRVLIGTGTCGNTAVI